MNSLAERVIMTLADDRLVSLVEAVESKVPGLGTTLSQTKRSIARISMRSSEKDLAERKVHQLAAFLGIRGGFRERYDRVKGYDISRFTIGLWENYNAQLERVFLPSPAFAFLRNRLIMRTMFMTQGGRWMRKELEFLEAKVSKERLVDLLQEDYVGSPILSSSEYLTSHNSVHHLYHVARFLDETGCDPDQLETVIEWGGGYGNMAKIVHRVLGRSCTYIIIDTPLFSCLQWLYLSVVMGKDAVNLLEAPGDRVLKGKVNLLPLGLMDEHSLRGDLFISTWGLSESSPFAQEYVKARNWFDCRRLLLGYFRGSLPSAEAMGWEELSFLPGQGYTFR